MDKDLLRPSKLAYDLFTGIAGAPARITVETQDFASNSYENCNSQGVITFRQTEEKDECGRGHPQSQ